MAKRWNQRRGLTRFDLIGFVAVGLMVFFLARLLASDGPLMAENRLEISAAEAASGFRTGEEWRGLYHGEAKVGFIRLRKTALDDGYAIEMWQVLELSMMGRDQRVELRVRTEADADFVLRAFDGELDSDGASFAIRGHVERPPTMAGPFVIEYEMETPASTQAGTLRLTTPPLIEQDLGRALLQRQPAVGETYEMTVFDPMAQADRSIVIEYDGIEELVIMAQTVRAHSLIQHMGQQSLRLWVNDLGEVLRQELPLGLTAERESRAEAMYGVVRREEQAPTIDLVGQAAVPLRGPPPGLQGRRSMAWRLHGVDPARFDLVGGRQRGDGTSGEAVSESGVRLTLDLEGPGSGLSPSNLRLEADIARYATPSLLVQSDAPAIRQQADRIVGTIDPIEDQARVINDWVHDNMRRRGLISVPSAVDVLASLEGDCNEHAVLATALLRARGVPARVASGLALVEDTFYYHAWVEFWDQQWRSMDPTWGQFPADLGHIRLVAGGLDRQVDLVEAFQHIEVELGE